MKIGYVRVSDDDQTEALQVDALTHAGCEAIYGDHGVSGSVIQRRGLEDVLGALEAGDTLVVWKLDRLGRSTTHLLLMLDELRQRDVGFIAVTQSIDTTTAIGRMVYGQLAVFAEFEREQIRERTKAGMKAAKKRGKHVGRPRKLSPEQIALARERIESGSHSLKGMAKILEVSERTLGRALEAEGPVNSGGSK
ncbi:MAG: recombinase family protein [Roseibium sp.]|nr:recombinase family protein [Roseibium sp.]MBO6932267.1 recombinase family protein [Roseibium sp.]